MPHSTGKVFEEEEAGIVSWRNILFFIFCIKEMIASIKMILEPAAPTQWTQRLAFERVTRLWPGSTWPSVTWRPPLGNAVLIKSEVGDS